MRLTMGARVIAITDSGTAVICGTDGGFWGGRPELNTRILTGCKTYRLAITHPLVREIMDAAPGYGCGYDCGQLHPITAAQEQAIVEAAKPKPRAAAPRETRPASMPCPRCHTYCDGDCRF